MTTNKNSKLFLVLFLGTLSAFAPFVTDLYLPALVFMGEYFSADTAQVQLTLTGSMVGMALGQLLIGPISDKYGRKNLILVSLFIYLLATIFIIFSPNIEVMSILRFFQGVFSASSVVISRAVATDLYSGKGLKEFFSLLMAVNGMAPIISPVFGSVLLQFVSWKGVFVALAILGFVLIVVGLKFVESLPKEKRLNASLLSVYGNIPKIFKNRKFLALVLVQSFAMSALFGYIAASPFILQTEYGLSTFVYSLFFAVNGSAIVIGTRVSSFLSHRSVLYGLGLMFISSLLISLILVIKLNVFILEVFLFLLLLGLGMMIPSMSAAAMNSGREFAGTASAVLGFSPSLFGGIVSPLVGLGNLLLSTSIVLVLSTFLALAIFLNIRKTIKN